MPPDNDEVDKTVGSSQGEPESTETDTAGSSSNGAETTDPESKAAGGKNRDQAKKTKPDTADTDSETDDVDLADTLALLTDPPDEKGEKEAKDQETSKETAEDDQATDGEDDNDVADDDSKDDAEDTDDADDSDEEKQGEETAEDDPDKLTDTEQRALSKGARKKLERLLKLKPAARFGEDIASLAHQGKFSDEASIAQWIKTGGLVNTATPEKAAEHLVTMALNVQTQGKASRLPPAERAALLRSMADKISPSPKPRAFALPDDLQTLVSDEALSKEDAEVLALRRLDVEEKAKAKSRQAESEESEESEAVDAPAESTGPTKVEYDQGINEAKKVYGELQAKYPSDWPRLSKMIVDRVRARSERTHPLDFAALVRDQADVVIAKLRPATKTPPKSPAPTKRSPSRSEETTDDDLLAMTIGEKPFPKR